MFVCLHTCVHACVQFICISVFNIHVYICAWMYESTALMNLNRVKQPYIIQTCVCVCVRVCLHVCVFMCLYVRRRMFIAASAQRQKSGSNLQMCVCLCVLIVSEWSLSGLTWHIWSLNSVHVYAEWHVWGVVAQHSSGYLCICRHGTRNAASRFNVLRKQYVTQVLHNKATKSTPEHKARARAYTYVKI